MFVYILEISSSVTGQAFPSTVGFLDSLSAEAEIERRLASDKRASIDWLSYSVKEIFVSGGSK